MTDDAKSDRELLRELIEEIRALRAQMWVPPAFVAGTVTYPAAPATNEVACAHESCVGCKNGTCNGIHMLVCYCHKCQPYCLTSMVKP